MNPVMNIINKELERINQAEGRDDKVRFNPVFIRENPGLYFSMCLLFVVTMVVLIGSDIFSQFDVWLCVAVFVALNSFFFLHIDPAYYMRDIDRTAWRNCYTGEWFREREVSPDVLAEILAAPGVSAVQKAELTRRMAIKNRVHYVDIRDIAAWRETGHAKA